MDPTPNDLVANDTWPKNLARRAQSSYLGPMRLPERIKVDRDIMMGKPCVRDTRIPAYLLLQKMAAGENE